MFEILFVCFTFYFYILHWSLSPSSVIITPHVQIEWCECWLVLFVVVQFDIKEDVNDSERKHFVFVYWIQTQWTKMLNFKLNTSSTKMFSEKLYIIYTERKKNCLLISLKWFLVKIYKYRRIIERKFLFGFYMS